MHFKIMRMMSGIKRESASSGAAPERVRMRFPEDFQGVRRKRGEVSVRPARSLRRTRFLEWLRFLRTFDPMKKETMLRIAILLALAAGYLVVAVLRSGTAW